MSYIVWDNGECHIYSSAKRAWGYIQPILNDNPGLTFYGFSGALANVTNHVAVLRQSDTEEQPWKDYPTYLQPIEAES